MAFQDHGSFEFVQDRNQEPLGLYRGLFKRALDITAVTVLAIPVTIVVLVLAAFVALDGKNPFYFQKRLGRQGRSFKMVKLRSMVANADAILADYLAANPAEARE